MASGVDRMPPETRMSRADYAEVKRSSRWKVEKDKLDAYCKGMSPEILQTLLNLAEFMEQCRDGDLPIDISILADLALRCRNYAKALHYKEQEFNVRSDGGACIEDLISINRKLDLPGEFVLPALVH